MTSTIGTRPVRRETPAYWRNKPIVIELGSHSITVREKGRRSGYSVSYAQIYALGAKNAAAERLALKRTGKGRR